ncbi:MAG: exodeoxyribonuclease VII large subunit [Candidatus Dasytiphilus stammeri]
MIPLPHTILSVSSLNKKVRQLIDEGIGKIWLSAEVSNFSNPVSGHWYFTLKDNVAQVRCVMFRNYNRNFLCPKNGQQIIVLAGITLYEPRGDYQLIIESIQPIGEGLLHQEYERIKKMLASEGLFSDDLKKKLPKPAHQVGIITSITGAALYDILRILNRRDPLLPIIIYPAIVQGDKAPESIINAINLANKRKECDVLIVGRGGGSLEDLWCFNNENVARSICSSTIPIVSAIGHETDVTIADLVADIRASTPSGAAELISRNQLELLQLIQNQKQHIGMAIDYIIKNKKHALTSLYHQLREQHPQLYLTRKLAILTNIFNYLNNLLKEKLNKYTHQYTYVNQRLFSFPILARINKHQQHLQNLLYRLHKKMDSKLNDYYQYLTSRVTQLEAISPLATIKRGYGIITLSNDNIVKTIHQLKNQDLIKIRLIDGFAIGRIISTIKMNPNLLE